MELITLEPVFPQSGPFLMTRVKAADGDWAARSDISAIELKVFDDKDGTQVGTTSTLAVNDVMFDTLQTDARWTKDLIGYNFGYQVLPAQLPKSNRAYRFEFKFTPTLGEQFYSAFVVPTLFLRSIT